MSDYLAKLLVPRSSRTRSVATGVVIGIVTNNQDPDGLHRVRVRFPSLSEAKEETFLARVATLMAGDGRGVGFLPEKDDEVLCAFENGDMNFPYIIGSLWNGQDKPPAPNTDGNNDIRMIRSRSGHELVFNDKGQGTLEIISGGNSIVIDRAADSITVTAEKHIKLSAPNGTITISGQTVKIEASKNGSFTTTGGPMTVSAPKGALTVKGTSVDIN